MPFLMVVPADSPWKGVNDLVAAARAKSGGLTYGAWRFGSIASSQATFRYVKVRYLAVAAPRGVAPGIVTRISAEMTRASADPELRAEAGLECLEDAPAVDRVDVAAHDRRQRADPRPPGRIGGQQRWLRMTLLEPFAARSQRHSRSRCAGSR